MSTFGHERLLLSRHRRIHRMWPVDKCPQLSTTKCDIRRVYRVCKLKFRCKKKLAIMSLFISDRCHSLIGRPVKLQDTSWSSCLCLSPIFPLSLIRLNYSKHILWGLLLPAGCSSHGTTAEQPSPAHFTSSTIEQLNSYAVLLTPILLRSNRRQESKRQFFSLARRCCHAMLVDST